jgi:uncharacterized coiled-coil DUF342 family protein
MTETINEISRLRKELSALSEQGAKLRKQLRKARKKRDAKNGGRKHRVVACDEESYQFIKSTADEHGVTCNEVVRKACVAYSLELSEEKTLREMQEDDDRDCPSMRKKAKNAQPNGKAEKGFPV